MVKMKCCVQQLICEAKCCSVDYAEKHLLNTVFGNSNEEAMLDYETLLMYIDVLERNNPEAHYHTKEKVKIIPEKIDISSLKKENNTLILDIKEKTVCKTVEIEPCLSDSDICKIKEHIKIMCSSCNCNCK